MPSPNKTCSFPIPEYDVIKDSFLYRCPRSELLIVSVNPYTGSCVLSFQRDSDSLAMLDYLFSRYMEFSKDFKAASKRSATFSDFVLSCSESRI